MALLPVLGILGLAAAGGLKPGFDNWRDRIRGRYNQSVMEGVDQNDPNATRNALFGGGLLDGGQFQVDSRTGYEGVQNRDNATRRAQISAGPAYMNAQLARDKYTAQSAQQKATTDFLINEMNMPPGYAGTYLQDQFQAQAGVNSEEIMTAGMTPEQLFAYEQSREIQRQREDAVGIYETIKAQSDTNDLINPPWKPEVELTGQQQTELLGSLDSLQMAEQPLNDAIQYLEETTRLGRVINKGDRAKLENRLAVVVDAIRQAEDKGVLQQQEAEELRNRMANLGGLEGRNIDKLQGVMSTIQEYKRTRLDRARLSIPPHLLEKYGGGEPAGALPPGAVPGPAPVGGQ